MGKVKEFSQDLRDLVIDHHKNGVETKEICVYLASKVHLRTIQRWIKEYKTGNINSNFKI